MCLIMGLPFKSAGTLFAWFLLLQKSKKKFRFWKQNSQQSQIMFFFNLGLFSTKQRNICFFVCNMFLIMFLIRKTIHIQNFIWNQSVISKIRVWPSFALKGRFLHTFRNFLNAKKDPRCIINLGRRIFVHEFVTQKQMSSNFQEFSSIKNTLTAPTLLIRLRKILYRASTLL